MIAETVAKCHDIVDSKDMAGLDEILADNATFHSPVVFTPQEGKAITTLYLKAAGQLFGDKDFNYVREALDGDSAVLEFEVEIDGILINGVDMIRINDQGRIEDFKVMIRPLKAINLMHQKMGEMLQQLAQTS